MSGSDRNIDPGSDRNMVSGSDRNIMRAVIATSSSDRNIL